MKSPTLQRPLYAPYSRARPVWGDLPSETSIAAALVKGYFLFVVRTAPHCWSGIVVAADRWFASGWYNTMPRVMLWAEKVVMSDHDL